MDKIKRTEILFLYDVRMANPNGDPARDNRPRIVNGKCFVTFDRIKRTIRDYWDIYENKDILMKIEKKGDTRENLLNRIIEKYKTINPDVSLEEEDLARNAILSTCIDARAFGALMTVSSKKKKNKEENSEEAGANSGGVISLIGPIQFSFGETLHEVQELQIDGTTQIQGRENKEAGTFTTKYVIRYGLFSVYGVVDFVRAERQGINLTDEDVKDVLRGLWYGTMNLRTTSKIGHAPRLLLTVSYTSDSLIGPDLQFAISATPVKEPIESISDLSLDYSKLISVLTSVPGAAVSCVVDSSLESFVETLGKSGIPFRVLSL